MTSSLDAWRPVGFSLGSNVGDRIDQMTKALNALNKSHGVRLEKASSFYETAPWGIEDQAPFINLCAIGKSQLSPMQLLQRIKEIEASLGRVTTQRWGPRKIDIDILYLGNETTQNDHVTIPHPHMFDRIFVIMPLAEIAPEGEVGTIRISKALAELHADFDKCQKLPHEKWSP